ncbi:basic salivary proline-rich protein 4-like [Triticum urartu]|uniref:basic salivary proline-rich protein 4-like n=1 Tax=Triticum urartu TaxID=4572 RepID=UPI002043330C|nr:basic salivary proline-rich protein 4-like [Triticum urartu]
MNVAMAAASTLSPPKPRRRPAPDAGKQQQQLPHPLIPEHVEPSPRNSRAEAPPRASPSSSRRSTCCQRPRPPTTSTAQGPGDLSVLASSAAPASATREHRRSPRAPSSPSPLSRIAAAASNLSCFGLQVPLRSPAPSPPLHRAGGRREVPPLHPSSP